MANAEVVNLFGLPRADGKEIEYWSQTVGAFTGLLTSTSVDKKTGTVTKNTTEQELRLVPATDLPKFFEDYQVVLANRRGVTTNPMKLRRTLAHEGSRFNGLLDPVESVGPTN
jgi:type IV secretion system protein VirD4